MQSKTNTNLWISLAHIQCSWCSHPYILTSSHKHILTLTYKYWCLQKSKTLAQGSSDTPKNPACCVLHFMLHNGFQRLKSQSLCRHDTTHLESDKSCICPFHFNVDRWATLVLCMWQLLLWMWHTVSFWNLIKCIFGVLLKICLCYFRGDSHFASKTAQKTHRFSRKLNYFQLNAVPTRLEKQVCRIASVSWPRCSPSTFKITDMHAEKKCKRPLRLVIQCHNCVSMISQWIFKEWCI